MDRCGSSKDHTITINITKTTGGSFTVSVKSDISVENFKKIVSKKLKIAKERICLLSSERELQDGTLKDNGIVNGSKIIVTPNVETGLAQRTENTVMQALESLNDSQVNDFLSGKSPLNLSVRLGDHMMLIQLQLSTLTPSQQNSLKQKVNISALKAAAHRYINSSTSSEFTNAINNNDSNNINDNNNNSNLNNNSLIALNNNNNNHRNFNLNSNSTMNMNRCSTAGQKRSSDSSGNTSNNESVPDKIQRSRTIIDFSSTHSTSERISKDQKRSMKYANDDDGNRSIMQHQSPIKSLSSLVSSPIKTTVQNHNKLFNALYKSPSSSPIPSDPISANLTSCLCKRLNISCHYNCDKSKNIEPSTSSFETKSIIKDGNNSLKYLKSELDDLKTGPGNFIYPAVASVTKIENTSSTTIVNNNNNLINSNETSEMELPKNQMMQIPRNNINFPKALQLESSTTSTCTSPRPQSPISPPLLSPMTLLNIDNPALAEASRNLTQTLKRLSKRVFTTKSGSSSNIDSKKSSNGNSSVNSIDSTSGAGSSGAIIESMKHHGKGIYSGTFSGTLNPALQDKNGRPKREISTIIHILNDLLSATPQCPKNGTKIYFEPSSSSTSTSTHSTTNSSSSNAPLTINANAGGKFLKQLKKYSSKSNHSTTLHIPSNYYKYTCNHPKGDHQTTSHHHHHHHQQNHNISNHNSAASTSNIIRDHSVVDCSECRHQMQMHRKLELENKKTKNKLDQLRLVMQQKKERREARKTRIAPYGTGNGCISNSIMESTSNELPSSEMGHLSSSKQLLENSNDTKSIDNIINTNSIVTNHDDKNITKVLSNIDDNVSATSAQVTEESSSSSSATATAIATSITASNTEIENHLEEVDTVA